MDRFKDFGGFCFYIKLTQWFALENVWTRRIDLSPRPGDKQQEKVKMADHQNQRVSLSGERRKKTIRVWVPFQASASLLASFFAYSSCEFSNATTDWALNKRRRKERKKERKRANE
jgi:hypothetical protein